MLPRRSDFNPFSYPIGGETPARKLGFLFKHSRQDIRFMDFSLLHGMVVGLVFGIVTIVFVSTMR